MSVAVHEERFHAAIRQFLRAMGRVNETYQVHVICERLTLHLDEGADWPEEAAGPPVLPGRYYSPLEQRIVDYLAGRPPDSWTTAPQIAAGLGESLGHKLKDVLSNLVDRDVIDCNQGQGYRSMRPARNGTDGPLRGQRGAPATD